MGPHISKKLPNINSPQLDNSLKGDSSDDYISIRKNSYDSRNQSGIEQSKKSNDTQKKTIDKEHVTIERIFRISLEESEKFLYLELFHAQLLSQDKEIAFRINHLDDITINIINHPERKETIFSYLLETYHRAVEMIEKRFKNEYDSSYKLIRKVIGNYITLIMYAPENFDLNLSKKDIYLNLSKYLKETDEEELGFFLMDIYNSTSNDISFLSSIFSFLFNIIHEDNLESKSHFFNLDRLKKNMLILTSLFEKCPLAAQAFVQEAQFNPGVVSNTPTNGKLFQFNSYLSAYLNVAIFEADINSLRTNFPITKSNADLEAITKVYKNKLNEYLNDVTNFVYSIYSSTDATRILLIDWMYSLLTFNFERTKMYQNNQTTSTVGFLLNSLVVLLKIFFDQQIYLEENYSNFIFQTVFQIDPLYALSNNKINFARMDRINLDLIKEIVENVGDEYNYKEYSLSTQLFFAIHTLMSFSIKTFEDEIGYISNKYEELLNQNKTSEPLFRDFFALLKAASCYLRNGEMHMYMLKFSEISSVFLFSLNNTKYPQISLDKEKIDYSLYIEDFHQFIDTNDNFALSLLPSLIPKNILLNSIFTRKNYSDVFVNEIFSSKIITYFSLIYSSQIDLIRNPHLRSEIFDILIYLFVINPFEKGQKIVSITKLLNEQFVRENLIISVMRVFIDAERLGTSNQFYEKFSIRHKILYLIENIMKANRTLFTQKIIDYANYFKEDCTQMINLLMNDLTFLNDECIERLMDIKRYQDLRDDVEKFNNLDEESKQFEENKFKDNDRRIRTELKLFNSSMEFMVMISNICQQNFLNYKLGEKLANLLNYSLDVFTSQRGLKLKIKNMKDYGFDPKFVLISLISVYTAFIDYPEFHELIVKDERSYKIINFEKVKTIYSRGKIKIDYDVYERFEKLVVLLTEKENEIKSKMVNYDDAPEEFFDPITTLLMEDPVILPSSKITLDRNTIETHLLSDPTDPFNRSKLSKDMLIPNEVLKNKILEYKKTK